MQGHATLSGNKIEIDVYGDGSCLFYSIIFSVLLPVRNQPDLLKKKLVDLFGDKSAVDLALLVSNTQLLLAEYVSTQPEELTNFINTPKAKHFRGLIEGAFRPRLVDFMEKNADQFKGFIDEHIDEGIGDELVFSRSMANMRKPGTWGDQREIFAAQQMLDIKIVVYDVDAKYTTYYPDPENVKERWASSDQPIYLIHTKSRQSAKEGNHYRYQIERIHFNPTEEEKLAYFVKQKLLKHQSDSDAEAKHITYCLEIFTQYETKKDKTVDNEITTIDELYEFFVEQTKIKVITSRYRSVLFDIVKYLAAQLIKRMVEQESLTDDKKLQWVEGDDELYLDRINEFIDDQRSFIRRGHTIPSNYSLLTELLSDYKKVFPKEEKKVEDQVDLFAAPSATKPAMTTTTTTTTASLSNSPPTNRRVGTLYEKIAEKLKEWPALSGKALFPNEYLIFVNSIIQYREDKSLESLEKKIKQIKKALGIFSEDTFLEFFISRKKEIETCNAIIDEIVSAIKQNNLNLIQVSSLPKGKTPPQKSVKGKTSSSSRKKQRMSHELPRFYDETIEIMDAIELDARFDVLELKKQNKPIPNEIRNNIRCRYPQVKEVNETLYLLRDSLVSHGYETLSKELAFDPIQKVGGKIQAISREEALLKEEEGKLRAKFKKPDKGEDLTVIKNNIIKIATVRQNINDVLRLYQKNYSEEVFGLGQVYMELSLKIVNPNFHQHHHELSKKQEEYFEQIYLLEKNLYRQAKLYRLNQFIRDVFDYVKERRSSWFLRSDPSRALQIKRLFEAIGQYIDKKLSFTQLEKIFTTILNEIEGEFFVRSATNSTLYNLLQTTKEVMHDVDVSEKDTLKLKRDAVLKNIDKIWAAICKPVRNENEISQKNEFMELLTFDTQSNDIWNVIAKKIRENPKSIVELSSDMVALFLSDARIKETIKSVLEKNIKKILELECESSSKTQQFQKILSYLNGSPLFQFYLSEKNHNQVVQQVVSTLEALSLEILCEEESALLSKKSIDSPADKLKFESFIHPKKTAGLNEFGGYCFPDYENPKIQKKLEGIKKHYISLLEKTNDASLLDDLPNEYNSLGVKKRILYFMLSEGGASFAVIESYLDHFDIKATDITNLFSDVLLEFCGEKACKLNPDFYPCLSRASLQNFFLLDSNNFPRLRLESQSLTMQKSIQVENKLILLLSFFQKYFKDSHPYQSMVAVLSHYFSLLMPQEMPEYVTLAIKNCITLGSKELLLSIKPEDNIKFSVLRIQALVSMVDPKEEINKNQSEVETFSKKKKKQTNAKSLEKETVPIPVPRRKTKQRHYDQSSSSSPQDDLAKKPIEIHPEIIQGIVEYLKAVDEKINDIFSKNNDELFSPLLMNDKIFINSFLLGEREIRNKIPQTTKQKKWNEIFEFSLQKIIETLENEVETINHHKIQAKIIYKIFGDRDQRHFFYYALNRKKAFLNYLENGLTLVSKASTETHNKSVNQWLKKTLEKYIKSIFLTGDVGKLKKLLNLSDNSLVGFYRSDCFKYIYESALISKVNEENDEHKQNMNAIDVILGAHEGFINHLKQSVECCDQNLLKRLLQTEQYQAALLEKGVADIGRTFSSHFLLTKSGNKEKKSESQAQENKRESHTDRLTDSEEDLSKNGLGTLNIENFPEDLKEFFNNAKKEETVSSSDPKKPFGITQAITALNENSFQIKSEPPSPREGRANPVPQIEFSDVEKIAISSTLEIIALFQPYDSIIDAVNQNHDANCENEIPVDAKWTEVFEQLFVSYQNTVTEEEHSKLARLLDFITFIYSDTACKEKYKRIKSANQNVELLITALDSVTEVNESSSLSDSNSESESTTNPNQSESFHQAFRNLLSDINKDFLGSDQLTQAKLQKKLTDFFWEAISVYAKITPKSNRINRIEDEYFYKILNQLEFFIGVFKQLSQLDEFSVAKRKTDRVLNEICHIVEKDISPKLNPDSGFFGGKEMIQYFLIHCVIYQAFSPNADKLDIRLSHILQHPSCYDSHPVVLCLTELRQFPYLFPSIFSLFQEYESKANQHSEKVSSTSGYSSEGVKLDQEKNTDESDESTHTSHSSGIKKAPKSMRLSSGTRGLGLFDGHLYYKEENLIIRFIREYENSLTQEDSQLKTELAYILKIPSKKDGDIILSHLLDSIKKQIEKHCDEGNNPEKIQELVKHKSILECTQDAWNKAHDFPLLAKQYYILALLKDCTMSFSTKIQFVREEFKRLLECRVNFDANILNNIAKNLGILSNKVDAETIWQHLEICQTSNAEMVAWMEQVDRFKITKMFEKFIGKLNDYFSDQYRTGSYIGPLHLDCLAEINNIYNIYSIDELPCEAKIQLEKHAKTYEEGAVQLKYKTNGALLYAQIRQMHNEILATPRNSIEQAILTLTYFLHLRMLLVTHRSLLEKSGARTWKFSAVLKDMTEKLIQKLNQMTFSSKLPAVLQPVVRLTSLTRSILLPIEVGDQINHVFDIDYDSDSDESISSNREQALLVCLSTPWVFYSQQQQILLKQLASTLLNTIIVDVNFEAGFEMMLKVLMNPSVDKDTMMNLLPVLLELSHFANFIEVDKKIKYKLIGLAEKIYKDKDLNVKFIELLLKIEKPICGFLLYYPYPQPPKSGSGLFATAKYDDLMCQIIERDQYYLSLSQCRPWLQGLSRTQRFKLLSDRILKTNRSDDKIAALLLNELDYLCKTVLAHEDEKNREDHVSLISRVLDKLSDCKLTSEQKAQQEMFMSTLELLGTKPKNEVIVSNDEIASSRLSYSPCSSSF